MEPNENDVERYEAYWDGFNEGSNAAEKELKHRFSQWLLLVQEEKNQNLLRIALDEKQKELSGRTL